MNGLLKSSRYVPPNPNPNPSPNPNPDPNLNPNPKGGIHMELLLFFTSDWSQASSVNNTKGDFHYILV